MPLMQRHEVRSLNIQPLLCQIIVNTRNTTLTDYHFVGIAIIFCSTIYGCQQKFFNHDYSLSPSLKIPTQIQAEFLSFHLQIARNVLPCGEFWGDLDWRWYRSRFCTSWNFHVWPTTWYVWVRLVNIIFR